MDEKLQISICMFFFLVVSTEVRVVFRAARDVLAQRHFSSILAVTMSHEYANALRGDILVTGDTSSVSVVNKMQINLMCMQSGNGSCAGAKMEVTTEGRTETERQQGDLKGQFSLYHLLDEYIRFYR